MNKFIYAWLPVFAGLAFAPYLAYAQNKPVAPRILEPKLVYQSVFERYQKWNDQPLTGWKKANDTVEQIGGWAVYAKEARTPDKPSETKEPAGHEKHGVKP